MITFTTRSGSIADAINRALNASIDQLRHDSPRIMSEGLLHTTRNHIRARYSGSQHWDPNRVTTPLDGSIDIDIAGAGRAYHDVTIRPVRARCLTIPIHGASYGKRVGDFQGLFRPKGKNVLMKRYGERIVALFALAKSAFQRQDTTLLPTDETYAKNIETRLTRALDAILERNLRNA